MDPARMFKESLTSRPELENSQGQKLPNCPAANFQFAPVADLHRHPANGNDRPEAVIQSLHLQAPVSSEERQY